MEENNNYELTLKNAEFCIKTESDFINNKYHNICTGEVTVVPTGTFDYMIGVPLLIVILAISVLAVGVVYKVLSD